ncbi:AfsR/SARP family transcriptional regulator [Streptomyces sp. L2]|uniref:AfsR/SARP family transcriptional regulator n=1 Tax=Streptomyces sp. L2 TaxID=2162665 RepID=UPI0010108572|nr:AfsR/SARP family transcriptional regulator [Streptomyces sp. L2]
MRRCELRFGLLGPPVLYDRYDRLPHDVAYDTAYDPDDTVSEQPVRVIGSPKVRALLAALLLEAGRVVSVASLKDALWGGAPPASAQASLHNHVTRLRRLLDDPDRLRAVAPGYLLRVNGGELDVHVFDARVAQARAAHARGDWERVVETCTAALTLWRGTPLSGVPVGVGGYALVQRLEEARLLALEWRYDAELALGGDRLTALAPELAALVAEHPLREAYHRQLMLALHRTGRQAEALAVHRDLRTRLIDELGIEPGPQVRDIHLRILRDTPPPTPAPEPRTASDTQPAAPIETARTEAARTETAQTETAQTETAPAPPTASRPAPPEGTPHTTATPEAADGADPPQGPPVPDDETRTGGAAGNPYAAEGRQSPHPDPPAPAPAPAPAPTTPRTPARTAAPAPAQLPPPPANFTGRTTELTDLHHTLTAERGELAVISGMAGVGKSALALHAAHALRGRFPDGQLYVNLRGAAPGMTPLDAPQALAALLRDLGVDPRGIPEHPDAATALLRSLLAPTRTLMVLDDAANAAQVRPLLPAGPGCAVIVTSRSPLTALDGARRFPLGPLPEEDSAALLRAVSGRDGLDASHALVGLTGGLPLALRVVAARLAARRALTPDVLAGQLTATGGRLRHLEYDDLSVRRSLAVAHDALAASERETDRDAARALPRIGALDLPTYGAPLVARLTGTDEPRAEAALDRLVDVALLEETAYGRYVPHGLVRDFARELAGGGSHTPDDTGAPAGPDVAALRWYAAVAERVLTAAVGPGLDRDDRLRPTAAQPNRHAADVSAVPSFASDQDAFAWADGELENIVTLVARHAGTAEETTAAHLCTVVRLLFPYVRRSGRLAEMEALGQAALGAARRLGDAAAEACALVDLAGLHFLTGRHSEALALNDEALDIWRRLGTVSWIRRCLNNRGLLLDGLGRLAESEDALRQSLTYSRQLNDPYGEAITHSHLGNLFEHTDPRAAIEQHRRSLAIGETIGAVIVRHTAHCNIGYAHLTLGEPAAAAQHFEQSLRILGDHGDWHGESQTRLGLVRALRLLGDPVRAGSECAELLRRADDRADRYVGGLARHQSGLLLRDEGRHTEAYDTWRAALTALDGTDEQTVAAELRELLAEGPMP